MKEYNEKTIIKALQWLLDSSEDVLLGNAVSPVGTLYYDTHNSLIDAIGLLGGDVSKYDYIDPDNPDIDGRV